MSAFDELYRVAQEAKRRDGGGLRRDGWQGTVGTIETFDLERIGAALDSARQSEGQPLPEHYVLPDYPGQAAPLRIDGTEVGTHGLIVVEGDTLYQAHSTVDGVTPALQLRAHRWFLPMPAEQSFVAFGEVQATGEKRFDRAFHLRATSRAAAVAFLTPPLVEQLMRVGGDVVSITVRPELGRTGCEVRVEVSSARQATPAIALARAAHAATETLVGTPGGFVATSGAHALAPDQLLALVERVRDTVSFLAGHVARVGDGVEARLELDRPSGLASVLRIEPANTSAVRVSFRGELPHDDRARRTTLTPELGVLKRAKGLVDTKVGDALLDRAFLIEGDAARARLALADPSASLRLAGRGAALTVDGAGLDVRVPDVPLDDSALLEVVLAALACWRGAALRAAGLVVQELEE